MIAEVMGGGSIFFTPGKRHLLESVSGINIDRHTLKFSELKLYISAEQLYSQKYNMDDLEM